MPVAVDGLGIGLASGAPATYDTAGFAALSYTDIDSCVIVDGGGFGTAWTKNVSNTLCPEGAPAAKGKREFNDAQLTLEYESGSAVETLLETAEADQKLVLSLNIILSNGDVANVSVLVAGKAIAHGTSGANVTKTYNFFPQGDLV